MSNSFGNDEYFEKMFDSKDIDSFDLRRIKTAFKFSHDVRKFEIELFWKRGTYYWAFILASFTAYFASLNKIIGENDVSLRTFTEMPILSKIILLILSCTTLIFCFSWVLINKGAKFWQKNWEAHVDMMEDMFSGKLYKTILNTENEEFNLKPWSKDAYDYSVTKLTTVGSIFLMWISGFICLFHVVLLFCNYKFFIELLEILRNYENGIGTIFGIIIVIFGGFFIKHLLNCKGNVTDNKPQKRWRQRELN